MVTDEQDQAIQVEMALRGEDICRFCGRVMSLQNLIQAEKKDGDEEALLCDGSLLDECIEARIEHDKRRAG